jgi:hypothetical protein
VPQPQVEWCAAVALQAELAVSQIVLQQREADFLKKEAEHNNKVGWLHAQLSVQLSHKHQIHGASEVGMWLLTFHCLFLQTMMAQLAEQAALLLPLTRVPYTDCWRTAA